MLRACGVTRTSHVVASWPHALMYRHVEQIADRAMSVMRTLEDVSPLAWPPFWSVRVAHGAGAGSVRTNSQVPLCSPVEYENTF
jgi:hypothetical protein